LSNKDSSAENDIDFAINKGVKNCSLRR